MMNQKLLTEAGWKKVAVQFKVKDNGLQRALANYEKLDQRDQDGRLKALGPVSQLAASLKKTKEVSALDDVVEYLGSVAAAAESEKAEIAKAAAARAQSEEKKKGEVEAKQKGKDNETEEEGEYNDRLLAAFKKLKSAKDLAYQFIMCDAKPHPAIMLARRIGPQHKEELTRVTNGGKRFLLGVCQFQDGKFVFALEQPVAGLARKLQDSIKNFTGKKLPIKVGTETTEEDEAGAAAGAPAPPSVAGESRPPLEKARERWRQTCRTVEANLTKLKQAVQQEFAKEEPAVAAEIAQNMARLDELITHLDQRLAESMAKAHAAQDAAARQAELKNSRNILAEYLQYIKSEELLIAHIDANPFGVNTNLKQTLTQELAQLVQATS